MKLQVSIELMVSMAIAISSIALFIHLASTASNRALVLLNSSAALLNDISRTYYASIQACRGCLN